MPPENGPCIDAAGARAHSEIAERERDERDRREGARDKQNGRAAPAPEWPGCGRRPVRHDVSPTSLSIASVFSSSGPSSSSWSPGPSRSESGGRPSRDGIPSTTGYSASPPSGGYG